MIRLGRIAIVGGSLAGLRCAQTLRRKGFDGALTIVGEESRLPYNRPPLSKELLEGRVEPEQIGFALASLDADWLLGRRATALDLHQRLIVLDDAETVPFDGLVVATGAYPKRLRGATDITGVFALRTVDDCLAIRRAATTASGTVVVIGAGFVGSEVTSTFRALGLDVTVVDPLPLPLPALGPTLGAVCVDLHRESGVDLRLGRSVISFEGRDRLERVVLDDGSTIETEAAIVGIGVTPATGWLEGSGLVIDDGVVCDSSSAALGWDDIVVAGDVARWPHPLADGELLRVEHWSNAVEQGIAAAITLLAGPGRGPAYAPVPSFWSDQFGVRIQSLGLPHLADRSEIVAGSLKDRRFVMLFGKEQRVVGAVAFGDPRGIVSARSLIATHCEFERSVQLLKAA